MNSFRKQKEDKVSEIKNLLDASKSFVVAEYHGLSVTDLQELRQKLDEFGIKAKVFKNRLFKLAIGKDTYEKIEEVLIGPNLFIFSPEDEIAPAKIIADFAKDHEHLKLKAGIYEGKLLLEDEIAEIAKLPSKEEALTMLATSLMAPLRYISVGLDMIANQDE